MARAEPPKIKGQAKPPQRTAVLCAKLYAQELGIPIRQSIVHKVAGVLERTRLESLLQNSSVPSTAVLILGQALAGERDLFDG